MRINRSLEVCFAFAFLSQALHCVADDWPQWRGPQQNGHVPGKVTLPNPLPSQPTKIWSVKVGDGFSSPVVAGGRAFFMDTVEMKETLHAVNADTGKELWKASIDDVTKDTQGPAAPRSTPTVYGDKIYAQSCKGELQCRDVADGKLIWRTSFTNDFGAMFYGETGPAEGATRHGNTGSPVVDGTKLITLVGSTNGASVVCFNRSNGGVLWKSQNDESGYSPAVIATIAGQRQYVVFTCDGVIGLHDKNGSLLWRFPIKTRFARHVTTPVIVGNMVMVSSHEHGMFGIRLDRKEAGKFEAVQAWLVKDAAVNFSSPVAVDGFLYAIGPKKNLICVDINSGGIAWSQDGLITSSAGKAHASFLVFGKNILMCTDAGELILFPASPKGFALFGRVQVCGNTWSSIAFANGKLYVRDGVTKGGSLACFELH